MNMLEKVIGLIPDKRTRNVAMAVGGMGALLAGSKLWFIRVSNNNGSTRRR